MLMLNIALWVSYSRLVVILCPIFVRNFTRQPLNILSTFTDKCVARHVGEKSSQVVLRSLARL